MSRRQRRSRGHSGASITPLQQLYALLGATPTFAVHADDAVESGGILTSWPGKTAIDATPINSPTVVDTGWGGSSRVVNTIATGGHIVHADATAAAYANSDAFTFVAAVEATSGNHLFSFGKSTNDSSYHRVYQSGATAYNFQTVPVSSLSSGGGITVFTRQIVSLSFNGSDTATMVQLTSGGSATVFNDTSRTAPSAVTDPDFDQYTLGALRRIGTTADFNAAWRWNSVSPGYLTAAQQLAVLQHIRDNLACPL